MAQEKVEFPITGKITSINVKAGDTIKEGETICLIEAMKMENPILSPVSGKVSQMDVSVGQVVEVGQLVAVIEY